MKEKTRPALKYFADLFADKPVLIGIYVVANHMILNY